MARVSLLTRRTTELLLLIAGALPVLLIYGMYLFTANAQIELTVEAFAIPIGLFVAFAGAHIAIRFFAPGADPVILPITFVLAGIGITFVTRLRPDLAVNQVIWLFLSIGAMVATLVIVRNLDDFASYKYTLGIVGIVLLVLPMIIGTEQGGSKLWLTFGPFSFQPGEIAKVLIILFLAAYLSENRETIQIPLVTKPASVKKLDARAQELFERGSAAHDLYVLQKSAKERSALGEDWRRGPFIGQFDENTHTPPDEFG